MGPEGTVGPIEPYRFAVRAGVPVLTFPLFDGHPVEAVVTTRAGGVSTGPYESLNLGLHVGDDPDAVVENRCRAAFAVGTVLDDVVFCNQAHGRTVATVGAGDRGRGARTMANAVDGADALVTTTPGVTLAVLVADCVPLVLFHPAGWLACVHAGWRGTVARVTEAAVEAIGAPPGELLAAIGPAVGPERYEVGDDVADAARDALDGEGLVRGEDGRWRFDLWRSNHRQLVDAGVDPANIAVAAVDTADPRFFSDRLERPCGRFAALARLR